jgi:hypothetical protein
MKFIQVEQNSDEWRRERLGKPTASNFHLIITPLGKPVDSRERKLYKYRLVAERILGEPVPSQFEGNDATKRGLDMEPRAVSALEATLGKTAEPGGFIMDDDERIGCSPDRVITRDFKRVSSRWQGVEVKCPLPWTHIGHMIDGPGDKYKPQVQGQIWIGRFEAVHFWSYHPSFAPVHIVTIPDRGYIEKMRNLVQLFCDEVDAAESWVRRHGNVEQIVQETCLAPGHNPDNPDD